MRNNSVIIATDAGFYAESLREKLRDAECRVFIASTVNEFAMKIKANAPQFVFIEHCFYGPDTETVIFKMAQCNRNMHIMVWAASKLNQIPAVPPGFIMRVWKVLYRFGTRTAILPLSSVG